MAQRTILAVILLVSWPVSATSGIIDGLKAAKTAVVRFGTHPATCKWGFYVAWIAGRGVADALVDAYQFDGLQPGGAQTRIINQGNFHVIKNARDICTIIAGGFLGIAYGRKYIDEWGVAKRFAFASAIAYPTWRGNYTHARWNDWWDTSPEHTAHLIPYPSWNLKDRYIRMNGWRVTAFYSTLYGVGMGGMVFNDPAKRSR